MNSIYKLSFFLFLFSFTAISAHAKIEIQKRESSKELSLKTDFRKDIVYKITDRNDSLKLDIYRPQNSENRALPVVMYIHGGAWVLEDKVIPANSYEEKTILKLLANGFAVVSINYRLVNDSVHFPLPGEDCKDAVRWLRKNKEKYSFDTSHIGLWGGSAGGHLCLLTAYSGDEQYQGDSLLSAYSSKVDYVMDDFGPTELNDLFRTKIGRAKLFFFKLLMKKIVEFRAELMFAMTGHDPYKEKEKVFESFKHISPLYMTSQGVPTQILHGSKDKIVPLKQSELLRKSLTEKGIECDLHIIRKANHAFLSIPEETKEEVSDLLVKYALHHSQK